MNKFKAAFNVNDNLIPIECLNLMLKNTNKRGIVYVPKWPYERFLETCFYKLEMHWDNECKNKIIEEYNKIYADILNIAKQFDSIDKLYDSDILSSYLGINKNNYDKYDYIDEIIDVNNMDYIIKAIIKRVCALIVINASIQLINTEASILIQALAIKKYASKVSTVYR